MHRSGDPSPAGAPIKAESPERVPRKERRARILVITPARCRIGRRPKRRGWAGFSFATPHGSSHVCAHRQCESGGSQWPLALPLSRFFLLILLSRIPPQICGFAPEILAPDILCRCHSPERAVGYYIKAQRSPLGALSTPRRGRRNRRRRPCAARRPPARETLSQTTADAPRESVAGVPLPAMADNGSTSVIACAITCQVVSGLFVSARFYSRGVITRALGWDDYSILTAWVWPPPVTFSGSSKPAQD